VFRFEEAIRIFAAYLASHFVFYSPDGDCITVSPFARRPPHKPLNSESDQIISIYKIVDPLCLHSSHPHLTV